MKQLSRSDARLLSDIREADDQLARLPEAMLEKDVFITEALLAVAALRNAEIGVTFCGGTSLSKAHRLIERMSEDVDFKLHVVDGTLSKNARRNLLGSFRDTVVAGLRELEYEIEPKHIKSRDGNSYNQILLSYKTSFGPHAAIRADVVIELNASSPRVATVPCEVKTLVSSKLNLSRSGAVHCLNISETVAEKLVGFTRRVSQELCGKTRGEFDATLVRHLYDVYQLSAAGILEQNLVSKLAAEISKADAIEFASQHPEYATDAKAETTRVLEALVNDKRFQEWYARFVNTMIYGAEKPDFQEVARDFQMIARRSLGLDAPA